jgi:hypothetical protein
LKLRLSPSVFIVAFCCVYVCVFALDWPLFRYYPLHGDFGWGMYPPLQGVGPVMVWYGLIADAGIAATLLAFCVPDRAIDRLLGNYLWLFPCGAMLACVFLLRKLFARARRIIGGGIDFYGQQVGFNRGGGPRVVGVAYGVYCTSRSFGAVRLQSLVSGRSVWNKVLWLGERL